MLADLGVLNSLQKHRWMILALLALLGLTYARVIPSMVGQWNEDPNYSHGFLVPFVSAYFLWQKRHELSLIKIRPNNLGLLVILGSLSLLIIGFAGTEYYSMRTSLVFLIGGIVLYLCGWPLLKGLSLPIGFLFFMVPLPYIVYDALAFPLKLFVAKFSVVALKLMGVVVWREGNIISFPETVLEVADACSGLRSLMSLLALAVAFAFFTQKTVPRRLFLVFMALPIAIFTNMLRVIGTGFLAQYYGAAAAEGFFHEFAGLAVFALAMLLLVVTGTLIRRGGQL
ncbi:MAG: exosortase/archaeosortase family protein [Geopsychrobacter sp.]|nr:exosortase/archaeosortase family protein [Geopsychrobacter sp.]